MYFYFEVEASSITQQKSQFLLIFTTFLVVEKTKDLFKLCFLAVLELHKCFLVLLNTFWLNPPCKVRHRIWVLFNWDPIATTYLSSSAEPITFPNNEITSAKLHMHPKMENWDKFPAARILYDFRIIRFFATWTMFAVFIAITNGCEPIVTGFTLKFQGK